ncbi:unnamed protein product, partial [Gulo gulo]
MPFLHNFSFQCHTLEQSILQITKLKVERFTNCQQVITHHLVVGKAVAIRKGRGWVKYLKTLQGRPVS